jgi:hypothetical protein
MQPIDVNSICMTSVDVSHAWPSSLCGKHDGRLLQQPACLPSCHPACLPARAPIPEFIIFGCNPSISISICMTSGGFSHAWPSSHCGKHDGSLLEQSTCHPACQGPHPRIYHFQMQPINLNSICMTSVDFSHAWPSSHCGKHDGRLLQQLDGSNMTAACWNNQPACLPAILPACLPARAFHPRIHPFQMQPINFNFNLYDFSRC